jgi:hypothetical protein
MTAFCLHISGAQGLDEQCLVVVSDARGIRSDIRTGDLSPRSGQTIAAAVRQAGKRASLVSRRMAAATEAYKILSAFWSAAARARDWTVHRLWRIAN